MPQLSLHLPYFRNRREACTYVKYCRASRHSPRGLSIIDQPDHIPSPVDVRQGTLCYAYVQGYVHLKRQRLTRVPLIFRVPSRITRHEENRTTRIDRDSRTFIGPFVSDRLQRGLPV